MIIIVVMLYYIVYTPPQQSFCSAAFLWRRAKTRSTVNASAAVGRPVGCRRGARRVHAGSGRARPIPPPRSLARHISSRRAPVVQGLAARITGRAGGLGHLSHGRLKCSVYDPRGAVCATCNRYYRPVSRPCRRDVQFAGS